MNDYNSGDYEKKDSNNTTSEEVMRNEKTKKKTNKRFSKIFKFIGAAILFGLISATVFHGSNYLLENNKGPKDTFLEENELSENSIKVNKNKEKEKKPTIERVDNEIIAYDISEVVEAAIPSIVAINSKTVVNDFDVFGRPFSQPMEGSGSGVIIGENDEELLIVTNNHVIEGAEEVEIVFVDNEKAVAQVKGRENRADLAVLSVDLKDLSEETSKAIRIAKMGDSDNLKMGELAIAIGNALGYGQSVTVGYISGKDRKVSVDGMKLTLLQTDAAINPGNSGGALLNSRGELIGINSVKYAAAKVEGMGFAIPISDAIPVIDQLMEGETIEEEDMGFLGISTATARDISKSDSERFSMPLGIYINDVIEDSPAAEAGLKQGDIIVGLDNREIEELTDLIGVLKYKKIGQEIKLELKVFKDGKYIDKEMKVILGERPEE